VRREETKKILWEKHKEKKRNPKYFNKNHNGVYNNKEKAKRTKKP